MDNSFRRLSSYLIISTSLLFFSTICKAGANAEPSSKAGNFALPSSQQPGPLIGFGQDIIDKNETQLFLFADDYKGINQHFIDLIPSVLYGITDNLSFLVNAPYAASFKSGEQQSSGFEDGSAQIEYAFYNKSTSNFVDQATVVTNMSFPMGSTQKNPPTGVGSPSFFLGTTYNRKYVKWSFFGSPGAVLTTDENGTQFGNSYLYQCGLGRSIADTGRWIFAWMTEVDGTYTQKNKVSGVIDPNSGGNVIYLTPSLWASTKKFIFQFGIGFPVSQHWYGKQINDSYFLATNISWSIY